VTSRHSDDSAFRPAPPGREKTTADGNKSISLFRKETPHVATDITQVWHRSLVWLCAVVNKSARFYGDLADLISLARFCRE
jgi:hypothetical protein